MEPEALGLNNIDFETRALASIAISLKRIADALESVVTPSLGRSDPPSIRTRAG